MTRLLLLCLAVTGLLHLNGCVAIGVAANALPQFTQPRYTALAGQSIAVMVWVDRGIKIDWPNLSLDAASTLENNLIAVAPSEKMLKDSTFPITPASVVRYQMDHPEVDSYSILEVAPKLGITRLIYIEIDDFGTRADNSIELYRGHMSGTIRVIEVTGKTAKVAYEENNISAVFPRKVPQEGLPQGNDFKIYGGTVEAFTVELLKRVIPVELAPGEAP